ncbi:SCO1/SenC-domain-containing protein [Suillus paluster]|uniref:SCO1/SenC-domain-containing protein n=1 Tax=Suillus paluster TaxID=48578 RepID=UPI001B873AAF|nr:SCO1/SenC-domain-containing protein [Suillus paluster]KAG1747059.1 SCO1/SenC-domain-containing protein [Suillus paluster]
MLSKHFQSLRPCLSGRSTRSLLVRSNAAKTLDRRRYVTSGARDRATVGVFTPKAAALFVATGVGLFYYFRYEKQKLLEQRQKELESRSVGRAHVGGPFTLTTHENTPFSDKDLLGRWNFVYFGFTNCPDICPAELDKIGAVLTPLEKDYGAIFQPVFISVDPARDSVAQMKTYLADFHPRIIGLTGDYATVKSTCKAYRVYFSTPPDADPKGDYLVDHSIYVYLMDPNGQFVEAFGQSSTSDEVVERVKKEILEYEKETGRIV